MDSPEDAIPAGTTHRVRPFFVDVGGEYKCRSTFDRPVVPPNPKLETRNPKLVTWTVAPTKEAARSSLRERHSRSPRGRTRHLARPYQGPRPIGGHPGLEPKPVAIATRARDAVPNSKPKARNSKLRPETQNPNPKPETRNPNPKFPTPNPKLDPYKRFRALTSAKPSCSSSSCSSSSMVGFDRSPFASEMVRSQRSQLSRPSGCRRA